MSKINYIVGVALSCAFLVQPAFADVAVIVNKANGAAVTEQDIKKIYLGKQKSFSDGNAVTVISLNDNEVNDVFNKQALQKSSSQLKSYWSKLIFTGKAKPPTEAANPNEVLQMVSSNANAIGYIDSSLVNDSVKVVATYK